jgi:hypothetical protein
MYLNFPSPNVKVLLANDFILAKACFRVAWPLIMSSNHAETTGLADPLQVTSRLGIVTYNHIFCLPVPPRRLIHPHTVLYEPNPIDLWLERNEKDAYRKDVFFSGFLFLSDVPYDQVLCTVVLHVTEVSWHMFNIYAYLIAV